MFRKHSLRIAALMCCAVSATAAAMDRGQFNNVPPAIREWFEKMRSPNGISCCSYADGHRTGYDIRQGQYWVPIEGEWYPVPPEAVIKTEIPLVRQSSGIRACQREICRAAIGTGLFALCRRATFDFIDPLISCSPPLPGAVAVATPSPLAPGLTRWQIF
jgi:hypothetical protein